MNNLNENEGFLFLYPGEQTQLMKLYFIVLKDPSISQKVAAGIGHVFCSFLSILLT